MCEFLCFARFELISIRFFHLRVYFPVGKRSLRRHFYCAFARVKHFSSRSDIPFSREFYFRLCCFSTWSLAFPARLSSSHSVHPLPFGSVAAFDFLFAPETASGNVNVTNSVVRRQVEKCMLPNWIIVGKCLPSADAPNFPIFASRAHVFRSPGINKQVPAITKSIRAKIYRFVGKLSRSRKFGDGAWEAGLEGFRSRLGHTSKAIERSAAEWAGARDKHCELQMKSPSSSAQSLRCANGAHGRLRAPRNKSRSHFSIKLGDDKE